MKVPIWCIDMKYMRDFPVLRALFLAVVVFCSAFWSMECRKLRRFQSFNFLLARKFRYQQTRFAVLRPRLSNILKSCLAHPHFQVENTSLRSLTVLSEQYANRLFINEVFCHVRTF